MTVDDDEQRRTPPAAIPEEITAEAPSERVRWIDNARGICILLVVLLHTQGALTHVGIDLSNLGPVTVALSTVRMPAFFLVSGLLAGSVIGRPRREFLSRRPVLFGYLYVVWSTIFIATFVAIAAVGSAGVVGTAATRFREFLLLDGQLWYLAALVVYFVLARLTRTVPPWTQLSVAALLWQLVSFGIIPTWSWGVEHLISLYVFFLAGLYGRAMVLRWADRVRPAPVVVLVVTWGAGLAVADSVDPDGRLRSSVFPLLGVPILIGLAVLVGRCRPLSSGLQRVGATTLSIYVLHPVILAGFGAAVTVTGIRTVDLPMGPALVVGLVAASAVVAACLVVARLLRPMPWLFALPARAVLR